MQNGLALVALQRRAKVTRFAYRLPFSLLSHGLKSGVVPGDSLWQALQESIHNNEC